MKAAVPVGWQWEQLAHFGWVTWVIWLEYHREIFEILLKNIQLSNYVITRKPTSRVFLAPPEGLMELFIIPLSCLTTFVSEVF